MLFTCMLLYSTVSPGPAMIVPSCNNMHLFTPQCPSAETFGIGIDALTVLVPQMYCSLLLAQGTSSSMGGDASVLPRVEPVTTLRETDG